MSSSSRSSSSPGAVHECFGSRGTRTITRPLACVYAHLGRGKLGRGSVDHRCEGPRRFDSRKRTFRRTTFRCQHNLLRYLFFSPEVPLQPHQLPGLLFQSSSSSYPSGGRGGGGSEREERGGCGPEGTGAFKDSDRDSASSLAAGWKSCGTDVPTGSYFNMLIGGDVRGRVNW